MNRHAHDDERSPIGAGSGRTDTLWMTASYGAGVITAIGLTLVATRVLSKQDVASLGWATSTTALLAMIAAFGTPQAAIRLISGTPAPQQSNSLTQLLVIAGTLSALTAALWWLLVGPWLAGISGDSDEYSDMVAVVALWVPATALLLVVEAAARARRDFRLAAASGEWTRRAIIVSLLLVIGAGATEFSLATALLISAGVQTIVAVSLLAVLGSPLPRPSATTWAGIRSNVRLSTYFLPTSLVTSLVPQAGVWIAAVVTSASEVADFSVAVRASFLASVPFFIAGRVLAPRIAAAEDLGSLEPLLRRLATLTATVALATLLAYLLIGESLLTLLFGDGYDSALPSLVMITVGQLISAGTGFGGQCLSFRGHHRVVAVISVAGGVAFLPAALAFGNVWGAVGVAAAGAVVVSAQNIAMLWYAHARLGLNPLPRVNFRRTPRGHIRRS